MTFRQPPEWAPHNTVWIGFPSHAELWEDDLSQAQAEVLAFARAVHAEGEGELVVLVAAHESAADQARILLGQPAGGLRNLPGEIAVLTVPFGDIWLRDTGPIIVTSPEAPAAWDQKQARLFRFNGWGGKYELPGDESVGAGLADTTGYPYRRFDWILEGGAIDVDGTGLAVTTEQCLLNPNRNPGMSRDEIEARLAADLGIERLLWLGEGLLNDHTDGHVDNLARFVAEGVLALPVPAGPDDPNTAVYEDARARAEAFGLTVAPIPSPGRVLRDGEVIPASYMNFYIGNAAVVVPLYGAENDDAAVAAIGALFPGRRAVGLRADHVLTGGGSFHCISQQVPR
jgi:agmatine deiminase